MPYHFLTVSDDAGSYVYVSNTIAELLGYSPEEYADLWEAIVHPDDRFISYQIHEDFLRSPAGTVTFTVRIRDISGVYHQFLITSRRIESPTTGHLLLTTSYDLTHAAIATERSRHNTVTVIVRTSDGAITHVSPQITDVLGWHPSALVDRPVSELVPSLADPAALVKAAAWEQHDVVNRQDGERQQLHVVAQPVHSPEGITAIVLTLTLHAGATQTMASLLDHPTQDDPTILPSEPRFLERAARALDMAHVTQSTIAILLINVDHFRRLNASLGMQQGDALLRAIAARLQLASPTTALVSRLDRDEFAILLTGIDEDDHETTMRFAQAIRSSLSHPFRLDTQDVTITASIGIATSEPDERAADAVFDRARRVLQEVKLHGRDGILAHATSPTSPITRAFQLRRDIPHAIMRREFTLHFQPIIDLKSGAAVAAEALLRWQHPQLGLIPPGDFLELIYSQGFFDILDQWVVEHAAYHLSAVDTASDRIRVASPPPSAPVPLPQPTIPFSIAVNVSAPQFANRSFAKEVERTIAESGIAPNRFILEFTEDALIRDMGTTIAVATELRAMGVRLALDDFGSGFSSLNYLRQLPLDGIKLDREFLTELGENRVSKTIVESMISMAHNLGMHVIAEGIETDEQLRHLQAMDCDYGQGFYLLRPTSSLLDCTTTTLPSGA